MYLLRKGFHLSYLTIGNTLPEDLRQGSVRGQDFFYPNRIWAHNLNLPGYKVLQDNVQNFRVGLGLRKSGGNFCNQAIARCVFNPSLKVPSLSEKYAISEMFLNLAASSAVPSTKVVEEISLAC